MKFKVKDKWLEACGYGHLKGHLFPILKVTPNMSPNPFYNVAYELEMPSGGSWTVLAGRGEVVA